MSAKKADYHFSMVEEVSRTRIVAMGVGGMGRNAMENLAATVVDGLELYSVNTDMQALDRCVGSQPIQIGAKRTNGKGAGGNSEVGQLSAEDDIEKLRSLVEGAELVFIAAGMGGGTGTGAAPVIAKLCREMGILSIGIVTTPMHCEGRRRMEKARFGLAELRKHVDSLVVIENENLSLIMDSGDVSIIEIFRYADEVLLNSVAAIGGIINFHGYINLDLADLRNVLKRSSEENCADVLIGFGRSSGADRGAKAAAMALSNPLLANANIKGADNLLINVSGDEAMGLNEAHAVVEAIVAKAGDGDREIYMGIVTDNSLGDELTVTLIATGMALDKVNGFAGAEIVAAKHPRAAIFREINNEISGPMAMVVEEKPVLHQDHLVSRSTLAGNENNEKFGTSPLVKSVEWQRPAYTRRACRCNGPMAEKATRQNQPHEVVREVSPFKRTRQKTRRDYQEPLLHMAC